ncbi:IS701 family transposase [Streptomyces sp. NPDC088170]|uniref:IS701 family transposase n=1 Tax=Streptomyces sp. NPDC088170 TaxID=3365834 RepID=UPI00382CAC5A
MFDQAMALIAGRFKRVEPRATARAFVLGLLSGAERKNCWRLAEQAGHARPGPMQRLLRTASWDADAVRDDIRAYVLEHLGADDGVLIVDDTGFLKKGITSAGVQRQYTGTAGRIENTQVGVFLAYASRRGRALIDRRLYLPDASWCQDAVRRTRAGVPDQAQFATKPTLAGQMIAAALDAGISASWATGDEAYGQDPHLRALLESRGIGYVLAVACSARVRINQGRTAARADAVADRLPASAWHRQSAGAGAKGPRYYDWAWIEIGTDGHRHLLIRRNPSSGEETGGRDCGARAGTAGDLGLKPEGRGRGLDRVRGRRAEPVFDGKTAECQLPGLTIGALLPIPCREVQIHCPESGER